MIHSENNDAFASTGRLYWLVADDNVIEQKITERMVKGIGCDVDVVSNGFEVVQAVRIRPYDVLLIDENMPELDVFATAMRVRRLPALWKQPWIIAVTSKASQFSKELYRESGIDEAITKPLDESRLSMVLARAAAGLPLSIDR